jgi:flagellar motor component MotA
MKNIIKYSLIFIGLILLLTLLGSFIAGNANVFEWESTGRFVIVLIASFTTVIIIINKEQP